MKTALIPPMHLLRRFEHEDQLHLALANLIESPSDPYAQFHLNMAQQGHYVILDNGAHELRQPVDPVRLLACAEAITAHEIVLPDVPFNMTATLDAVGACLDEWTRDKALRGMALQGGFRLQFVPQGRTAEEWRTCLFGLVAKWERIQRQFKGLFLDKPVLALPAKYTFISREEALGQWLKPYVVERGYQVHLLGWRYLWNLNDLAIKFPWIRSVDSAKPFVYGKKGILFDPMHEKEPEYTSRPDNYFDMRMSDHQQAIAAHNAYVFRGLARGKYKGYVK